VGPVSRAPDGGWFVFLPKRLGQEKRTRIAVQHAPQERFNIVVLLLAWFVIAARINCESGVLLRHVGRERHT